MVRNSIMTVPAVLMLMICGAEGYNYRHPGGMHTPEQLERTRRELQSGVTTATQAWNTLLDVADNGLAEEPSALEDFNVPGAYKYDPQDYHSERKERLGNDAVAAYSCALAYAIGHDLTSAQRHQYADKAAEILRDWSTVNKRISDFDGPLVMCYNGNPLMHAAELIWNYSGWTDEDKVAFRKWIEEVVYPVTWMKTREKWQNWNDWALLMALSICNLLEDDTKTASDIALIPVNIDKQIDADGFMPGEVTRKDKGILYTGFALEPLLAAIEVGRNISGEDYFLWVAPGGGSVRKAVEVFHYYNRNPSEWPYNSSPKTRGPTEERGGDVMEAAGIIYEEQSWSNWADTETRFMIPSKPTGLGWMIVGLVPPLPAGQGGQVLNISPNSLPKAAVGHSYSQVISATGGESPYAFSVVSGGLPQGVTLSSTGTLSGTPQGNLRTYVFDVKVMDGVQDTARKTFTLDVIDPRFSDVTYEGNAMNWEPFPTDASWDVAEQGDDLRYCIVSANNSDGDRLGTYSLLRNRAYSDFSLVIEAKAPSAGASEDFAALFGYQDADNYYYMLFNANPQYNQIFKVVGGARSVIGSSSSALITDSQFHRYRIDKKGHEMSVYRDGVLVMECTDDTFVTGSIGIGSFNDVAMFDNISVTTTVESHSRGQLFPRSALRRPGKLISFDAKPVPIPGTLYDVRGRNVMMKKDGAHRGISVYIVQPRVID